MRFVILWVFLLMQIGFANAERYNFVVKKGDNLSKYFKQLNLSNSLLMNLLNSSKNAKKLNNLKINSGLKINLNNGSFDNIYYDIGVNKTLKIQLNKHRFSDEIIFKTKNSIIVTTITVKNSFNYDGRKKGLTNNDITTITKALNNKINFNYLKKNDVFRIWKNKGRIAVIEYIGFKKHLKVFFFNGNFYNKFGKTSKTMFLKAPLKYKRISSTYTLKRFHPILKHYAPHRAIDYAANRGTKVHATANGVISFMGYKGPLGNVIMIKHRYGYKTVYAHLLSFKSGMHKGKKVKKRQIIGFVGSTGRSTGNHLHYELRHFGGYKNPLIHNPRIKYQLKGGNLKEFKQQIKKYEN